MGYEVETRCLDCGAIFTVSRGGGFSYHLVRCNRCGKTKSIGFDELGELHLRYLKGLSVPYSTAGSEHDENIRKYAQVEPISEKEYHRSIEAMAGKCKCGGNYTLDAPPRCPKCRSTRLKEGNITVIHD